MIDSFPLNKERKYDKKKSISYTQYWLIGDTSDQA